MSGRVPEFWSPVLWLFPVCPRITIGLFSFPVWLQSGNGVNERHNLIVYKLTELSDIALRLPEVKKQKRESHLDFWWINVLGGGGGGGG